MRRSYLRALTLLVGGGACTAAAPIPGELAAPRPAVIFGEGDPPADLEVTLETDLGEVHCIVEARQTPQTAAMFVGLARGLVTWRDPARGGLTDRPLYADLPFFRRIPGVLVQSGCTVGDGSGHPGYRLPVEHGDDDATRLGRAGALVMARYTAPPGRIDPDPPAPGHVTGSQFAVTLVPMPHLVGELTVLGRCTDLDLVDRLSRAAHTPSLRRVVVSTPPRGQRLQTHGGA